MNLIKKLDNLKVLLPAAQEQQRWYEVSCWSI
jgi:hypothetical protein